MNKIHCESSSAIFQAISAYKFCKSIAIYEKNKLKCCYRKFKDDNSERRMNIFIEIQYYSSEIVGPEKDIHNNCIPSVWHGQLDDF